MTGGNISTIFAYIADISQPSARGKYYSRVGAVGGAGFIVGPVIGGLTAKLGYEAPFFFAAAIALINTLWGYFNLPESLDKQQRARTVKVSQLNPFKQLGNVFTIPQLRWLLLATFLFSFPFAALTSNLPVLTKDSLRWDADGVGVLFFLVGVVDIIVQGGLIGRLLPRFGEAKVAIGGMVCEIIGYLLLGAIASIGDARLAIAGTIIFAAGDGLIGPCLTGLISQAVGPREQGRVQGGNQSVQSLARAVGPFWGGEFYARFGHSSPYWSGAVLVSLTIATIVLALPSINANPPTGTP